MYTAGTDKLRCCIGPLIQRAKMLNSLWGAKSGMKNIIKKIVILKIILLIPFSIQQTCKAAENTEFPKWINELRLNANKTLLTEVNVSRVNIPDRLKEGKCFLFCLKGDGSLKKVHAPIETTHKMFSSNGWKYIVEYQADGHGSSSFAYEKRNYFCNISVGIDSSCDDEETGHVPGKFWFEIYCREK